MVPEHMFNFFAQRVSIKVAARDKAFQTWLGQAAGCQIEPGGKAATLFLPEARMPELLQCLRENGTIAAVFCRPLNHQTYQLKGKVQAIRPLADSDRAAIDAYLTSWVEELAELGFGEDYARAIQPPVSDPTWAVTFRIEAVFDQTPGPKAGTAIPQVGLNP